MIVTQEVINYTLCELIPYPNGDVFSLAGFEILADWSEQQEWWHEFVKQNGLSQNWRTSYLGDPYGFVLTLFRFIVHSCI